MTGVSGSGPAYMYLILEAMADEGVRQGLDRQTSYQLAAQTMVGAGRMVLSTGSHPGVLKVFLKSKRVQRKCIILIWTIRSCFFNILNLNLSRTLSTIF